MTEVLVGAEAMSIAGGDVGVLLVHGYTGSPSSMRDMANAAASAGHSVEVPRIPGHGTSVEDLCSTGWDDWTSEVESAYLSLRSRVNSAVVVGLSAGATWSLWLALRHDDIDGMMFINPLAAPLSNDLMDQAQAAIDAGVEVAPGEGPDIAKPDVFEVAYGDTPLRPLLDLQAGVTSLQPSLGGIGVPMLVATSTQDHVVDPSNSDHLASVVAGPVTRISLERSFHVATQDHDQPLLIEAMLDFIKEVTP